MNNAQIWVWNPAGGAKLVRQDMVPSLLARKWTLLLPNELTVDGKPKQMYNPLYDGSHTPVGEQIKNRTLLKEILEVEVF